MKYAALGSICFLTLACNEALPPARTGVTAPKSEVASENTAQNVRDRDHATKTPIDQNENKADIHITAQIRKRVVDTKMSTSAHNVKIITQDGKVTLRGPVESSDEKAQIEELATAVAGADQVDNQLEVKDAK